MILRKLEIQRSWNGELRGEIRVEGEAGTVSLHVNEDLCKRLIEVCADGIVQAAKTVARDLTAEMLSTTKVEKIEARQ